MNFVVLRAGIEPARP